MLAGKYGFPPEVFQKVSKGAKELIGFPCLFGGTWMSQEVSKRLGSVGYNPNIPFTNFPGHPSRELTEFQSNQLFDGAVSKFQGELGGWIILGFHGCKWLGFGSPPHVISHE